VLDRENEEDGPIVWGMPQTVDKEIARRATGKGTNEVLPIDDPEDGYDVDFAREGTGFKTKYVGIEIARRSSPLHDDPEVVEAWLDYVVENPLPDLLVVHDYDYINKVFAGSVATESEAEEEGEEEEEEEKPKRIRPKRGSAKKQVEEEEEEDEDDEEDEAQEESEAEEEGEEEEEEEPTRRSAKSTLNKLRSRRRG